MKRGTHVTYAVKCFATGEIVERGLSCSTAGIVAAMETIARHDAMPEQGFATSDECSAAIAAATFEVTPDFLA